MLYVGSLRLNTTHIHANLKLEAYKIIEVALELTYLKCSMSILYVTCADDHPGIQSAGQQKIIESLFSITVNWDDGLQVNEWWQANFKHFNKIYICCVAILFKTTRSKPSCILLYDLIMPFRVTPLALL